MAERIKIGNSSIVWKGDEVVKLAGGRLRKELLTSAKAAAKDAAAHAARDTGDFASGIKGVPGKASKDPAAFILSEREIEVRGGSGVRVSLAMMREYGTVKMDRDPTMWPAVDRETPRLLARLKGAVD